jgi:small subunit ribosomal protein S33
MYICCCCRVQQRVERENIYRRWQVRQMPSPAPPQAMLGPDHHLQYTKVAVANTTSPTMAVTRTLALRLMEVLSSLYSALHFHLTPQGLISLTRIQTQCAIFNTTYNPSAFRTGNSVLRQRLRGPSMAAYYPRRVARFADLQKAYPGFETYDDFEEDRIESVAITKSRGKGAPKKKRTAAGKWEKIKRQRWRKKRTLLTSIQSRRSLARRRGKGWDKAELLCLAIYPTKAKARACKNTHRYMDFKSWGEEHWGCNEDRGVSWSYLGALTHIWRRKKLALYKKYSFQPSYKRGASSAIRHFLRAARLSRNRCVFFFLEPRSSSQDRSLQHLSLGKGTSRPKRNKEISSGGKRYLFQKIPR